MSNGMALAAVIPSLFPSLRANVPSRATPYARTRSLTSPAQHPVTCDLVTCPHQAVGRQQGPPPPSPPRSPPALDSTAWTATTATTKAWSSSTKLQESSQRTWGSIFAQRVETGWDEMRNAKGSGRRRAREGALEMGRRSVG